MQAVRQRPAGDPRDGFAETSPDARGSGRPVIPTRNGRGDVVVPGTESLERPSLDSEVLAALREAEREAALTGERPSLDDVLASARAEALAAAAG